MPQSLQQLRALVDAHEVHVVVSDLDGVLRLFDQSLWDRLDERLGLPSGAAFGAILGHPFLEDVVRGRGTHAQWRQRAEQQLCGEGAAPQAARTAVETWATTAAVIDQDVLGTLQRCRDRGLAVFVLTNGTDRVPAELSTLGLDELLGADGRFLLNTADLGAAKPEVEAFDRARSRIQEELGTAVAPERIVLLDDSPRHVRGAGEACWRAILHPGGRGRLPLP